MKYKVRAMVSAVHPIPKKSMVRSRSGWGSAAAPGT